MPRRLVAVAVAGALVLAGLAGCREVPTVAVYVGDAQLTNKQVDQLATQFLPAQNRTVGDGRTQVVGWFVLRELCRAIAREHDITIPEVGVADVTAAARQLGLTVGDTARLIAEGSVALDAIQKVGTAQAPTEADKREVYQNLVVAGQAKPDGYNPGQLDSPEMRAALAERAVLRDALNRYQLSVNPRYQPLALDVPFPVGDYQGFIRVSFQPGSPAVADER